MRVLREIRQFRAAAKAASAPPVRRKRQGVRKLAALDVQVRAGVIMITMPMYTINELNEHVETRWGAIRKSCRRASQRLIVGAHLKCNLHANEPPTLARLVRLSPGELDERDNLPAALKSVRDEIAAFYGVSDGPRGPIVWSYAQERGPAYGVRMELSW